MITNRVDIIYSHSQKSDIVIEWILDDVHQSHHPDPTTMKVKEIGPNRITGEPLILNKISPLEWQHHHDIDLYVFSLISNVFK